MKTLTLVVTFISAILFTLPTLAEQRPCKPIIEACMMATGINTLGKPLMKECVIPVVLKQKTLPNTNFSDQRLADCKVKIQERMQSQSM